MTGDHSAQRGIQRKAGWRVSASGCVALLLGFVAHPVVADERRWSVSPVLGAHSPRLTALNKGEFKAPLPGRGRLIFDQADAGQDFDFVVNNPLPEMGSGAEGGLEIGFRLDERNTLFFGASVWEGGSTSAVRTEMPFQGVMTPVGYERSGRLSNFQYFLGWQRTLLSEAKKFRLHGRFALHEIFDIDYREDLVFGFDTGAETFKRIIVMESQATGLLMAQLGLSGEYFLVSWLSIGADLGYTLSLRRFELGNASLSTDIQAEDNLNFRTPAQLNAQQRLTYLAEARSYSDVTYRDMELGFDGWRMAFRVNMYF
ncbi:MAG: hypothetical protein RBT81_09225 [Gammaproteobacteria bacterium]|jgi:hypothetical protein|nr:hypothetical protein [Gammaproteobacteria bacterium]